MDGDSSYSRFIAGDNSALGALVEKYNKSLVFYLTGMLGSVALAEDIAADTFVELLIKKPRLKTEVAFRAYLYKAARNNAYDHMRKMNRRGETVDISDMDLADGVSLEEQLLKTERDVRLHNAMARLPSDYKDVLHLLYFEDMDYATAAKVMKKSVKQITNLAYRGREALRKILEREGYGYEV